MKEKITISQSLIKDWESYQNAKIDMLHKMQSIDATRYACIPDNDNALCGHLFYRRHIVGDVPSLPTEVMILGQLFEYLCTGQLNREGEIPVVKPTKSGAPTEGEERAKKQAAVFQKTFEARGLKQVSTGVKLTYGDYDGIVDIIAELDGKPLIIDLKYSNLYDNRWDKMGWHNDSIEFNDFHTLQATHYTWLYEKTYGVRPSFEFWIFESSKAARFKILEMHFGSGKYDTHEEKLQTVAAGIELELASMPHGFIPYAEYSRCKDCPIFDKCEHAHHTPKPYIISI